MRYNNMKFGEEEMGPVYVMNYTNFSPRRKDPLKKEVRISNDETQLLKLLNDFKEENIKKGWEKVS